MDQLLLKPLNSLEAALSTLQNSLTQTNTYAGAPTAAKNLVQADSDITHALTLLHRHQQNHQRIQALRAEADTLHDNIKSIVQQCATIRHQAEDIVGAEVLDQDSSDDDSPTPEKKEIEYDTLLGLASRIARDNAVAAREVEDGFVQRKTSSQPQSNGNNGRPSSAAGEVLRTQEASLNLEQAHSQHWALQNAKGIAFPNGERLRQGALGRLQYLFEEEGSAALERTAEDILQREAAGRAWEDQDGEPAEQEDDAATGVEAEVVPKPESSSRLETAAAPPPPPQQVHRPPRPPRKKLDLEFPGSDDEED